MPERATLVVLLVLNAVVLLGQAWPAGAPPFARTVNIAFLLASFAYFLRALVRGRVRRDVTRPRADA
ncbi:MAG: hypothetical protein V4617_10040 [Gemmatimonadota bacterium]